MGFLLLTDCKEKLTGIRLPVFEKTVLCPSGPFCKKRMFFPAKPNVFSSQNSFGDAKNVLGYVNE